MHPELCDDSAGASATGSPVVVDREDALQPGGERRHSVASGATATAAVDRQEVILHGEDDDDEDPGPGATTRAALVPAERPDTAREAQRKGKKKKKRALGICLAHCKYDSVRRCSRAFGLKEMTDQEDWSLFWMDWSPTMDRVGEMKTYQKINHFPGMQEICRKDMLARNMNRLGKMFPKDYAIFPPSWCMPQDYGDFQAFCRQKKNKTFIKKPDAGCQGRGIVVTRNPKDISLKDNCVVQQYIAKPFLIDGFKFDYRIYVLVTSCDPLRIFVYRDGLARFCTVKYTEPTSNNVESTCMHLTNYAINKHSENFIRDDDSGSKRRITTVDKWFTHNGYDIKKIWADMEDVIIKTLIAAHPILKHNYRASFPNIGVRNSACFEVLGFDLMLDRKLKPWIIEVNLSPSFHTDAPLDKEVKEGLLNDALRLINLHGVDKKKVVEEEKRRMRERLMSRPRTKTGSVQPEMKAEDEAYLVAFEDANLGGYRRIYPQGNKEKYERFFENCGSLFGETAAYRARQECARAQRESIDAKLREKEMWKSKLQPQAARRPQDGTTTAHAYAGAGGRAGANLPRPESPQVLRRSRHAANPRAPSSRDVQHGTGSGAGDAARTAVEVKTVAFTTPVASTDAPSSHDSFLIDEEAERQRVDMLDQREEMLLDLNVDMAVLNMLEQVGNPIGGVDRAAPIPENAVFFKSKDHGVWVGTPAKNRASGDARSSTAASRIRQSAAPSWEAAASARIARPAKPPAYPAASPLRHSSLAAERPKPSPTTQGASKLITADPYALASDIQSKPTAAATATTAATATAAAAATPGQPRLSSVRRSLSFREEQTQQQGQQGSLHQELQQKPPPSSLLAYDASGGNGVATTTATTQLTQQTSGGTADACRTDPGARQPPAPSQQQQQLQQPRRSLPEPSHTSSIPFRSDQQPPLYRANSGLLLPPPSSHHHHHHQSSIPTTVSQQLIAQHSITATFLPSSLAVSGLAIAPAGSGKAGAEHDPRNAAAAGNSVARQSHHSAPSSGLWHHRSAGGGGGTGSSSSVAARYGDGGKSAVRSALASASRGKLQRVESLASNN